MTKFPETKIMLKNMLLLTLNLSGFVLIEYSRRVFPAQMPDKKRYDIFPSLFRDGEFLQTGQKPHCQKIDWRRVRLLNMILASKSRSFRHLFSLCVVIFQLWLLGGHGKLLHHTS